MKSELRIEKEIRVVGLRRSGNHAIINWILRQQKGEKVFLNDVALLETQYYEYINNPQKLDSYLDAFIYSYEDHPLNRVASHLVDKKANSEFVKVKQRFDILILRDPFNLFASRLNSKVPLQPKSRWLTFPDLWIMHAEEYLGITNYLRHNKIIINYNQWCNNQVYRQELAKRLELDFSDEGFEEVLTVGKGSSFDGLSYHGRASEMDVLQRWKTMMNNDQYIALFTDRKILKLSERIFGIFGDIDVLIDNFITPSFSRGASILRKIRFARYIIFGPIAFNFRYHLKKTPWG